MRQAEKKPAQAPITGKVPLFHEFDVVALRTPLPDLALDSGLWGNVLAVLPDDMYEVEFMERDGTPLKVVRIPAEMLELVWAEA